MYCERFEENSIEMMNEFERKLTFLFGWVIVTRVTTQQCKYAFSRGIGFNSNFWWHWLNILNMKKYGELFFIPLDWLALPQRFFEIISRLCFGHSIFSLSWKDFARAEFWTGIERRVEFLVCAICQQSVVVCHSSFVDTCQDIFSSSVLN